MTAQNNSSEQMRDKWKVVDGRYRDRGDGLITCHVNAFDEGYQSAAPAQAAVYIDALEKENAALLDERIKLMAENLRLQMSCDAQAIRDAALDEAITAIQGGWTGDVQCTEESAARMFVRAIKALKSQAPQPAQGIAQPVAEEAQQAFKAHLQKCSNEVDAWPDWKKPVAEVGVRDLPPLPEPIAFGPLADLFTAEQMHAYAKAAIAQSPARQEQWQAAFEEERRKFQGETLRASGLATALRNFVKQHEDTHTPGPWSRGCHLCQLVAEANAFLLPAAQPQPGEKA